MKTKVRAICLTLCAALVLAAPAQAQLMGPSSKVAYFHLDGPVTEKPVDPMGSLFGGTKAISLKDLLSRFKQARDDDNVKAVVITFEGVSMGLAQGQEVCNAIRQVRAADKEVYVHAEQLGNLTYALASSASHINMVPTGDLWLLGLYGETPYLKGLLEKIHIYADFVHIGAYKSASEILTREGPSPEAEDNMNWLLDGLYDTLVGMVADGRGISPEKAKALIDDGPYTAERALKVGMIDSVKYRQDFLGELKERYAGAKLVRDYGKDTGPDVPEDLFSAFSYFMDMFRGTAEKSTAPSVGVVYVEGAISTGSEDPSPFGGGGGAKSTSIRKALDKAAADDTVKAVVLRVDSPGGSALASEIIWNATQRVGEKKPLIVSMGNVAGSGGYYVSCGADTIFADEATITASIGVVGGKLVTTGMWDWMGVNWKEYQRGKVAAMMSSSHEFSDDERARILGWMTDVYEVFKQHVTDGRGEKLTKPLEEMAGGRVFTGKQALELGLVDKLGGLDDAVKYAALQANISDYKVRVIPKPKNIFEMLMEAYGGGDEEDEWVTSRVQTPLFSIDSPLMSEVLPMLQRLDPVRVQAVLRTLKRIELIHQEGVITMMPEEIIIR
ncbi:MAG TPA: signal peptide peptidase SppA [Phycisphaerae bacterium]|nr:signal peptide peptidase SppA [Phycisphaerae bacterium]